MASYAMSEVSWGNITRVHLASAIQDQIGFSKQISLLLVDAFFDHIKQALLADTDVLLGQFGRFSVKKKSSRMGRNPKSGEEVEIVKRSTVSFKPSKHLRAEVNGGAAKSLSSLSHVRDIATESYTNEVC